MDIFLFLSSIVQLVFIINVYSTKIRNSFIFRILWNGIIYHYQYRNCYFLLCKETITQQLLNFYGIWVPTFENLSTQFKLCWSFFMLLYFTQK
ncbi:uncharacterized protein LOC122536151 isoform X2 [Frieseomelitta varia]|uniref:uncharacterized protein LOC122536151 isoform X2 n=1 Tax=Frieseomelitta varia TaxID=561572 RepID=UPI001CB6B302|nr:uncharacterized protein LOC122536151 isoform X2 [Frieseomelitta varia]